MSVCMYAWVCVHLTLAPTICSKNFDLNKKLFELLKIAFLLLHFDFNSFILIARALSQHHANLTTIYLRLRFLKRIFIKRKI